MHVLWDWNGTLLDDTHACVGALNAMLTRRGKPVIGMDYFREHFAFPAREFYVSLGMDVPDSEWDALAREYYDAYAAIPVALNADAIMVLEEFKRRGYKQSIISALRQDYLEQFCERFGIRGYFELIYGSDNLDGGSKLNRAKAIYERLGRPEAVIIGDSLHEREIADILGIRCILHGQGSHSVGRLRQVAETVDTLREVLTVI